MLKIAIVGTGIIGLSHIEAIKKLDSCKLVALCDLNEEKVKKLAEENNVPYFIDYKDIPKSVDCDAVILNLPHGIHCESTVFFLEAGMHVLVEKPMANTVEECKKMIEASKKYNKKLAVAHIQRYFNSNMKVKEFIKSEEFGKLCMYNETRCIDYFDEKRPRWFLDKKMAGGGIVMNYGAHAFDKLIYATDAKPVSIDANCSNIKNGESIEGHAQIFAKFDNGVTATITFNGYSNLIYEAYYHFTNGCIRVLGSDQLEINRGDRTGWHRVDGVNDGLAIVREIEEFRKYVELGEANIPDGEYGMTIIDTIEKIYEHIV